MKPEYETMLFENAQQWRTWLNKHHADVDGVWLQYHKKDSGLRSIKYAEALDIALCFGWIDGQAKKLDELSYLQKFTPRRARSMWSKRNIAYVARLTAAGLMAPAGIAEIERAKADGRWEAAYDRQRDMVVPNDFVLAIQDNPETAEFYKSLNKSDLFTIGMQLQTAKKPETRERRFNKFLAQLQQREKPH